MRVWTAAGVIALVLIVGFVLSVPHLRDAQLKQAARESAALPIVYVHNAYKKGVHTLTVKVAAPNACTIISGSASVAPATSSSTPDAIQIALDMPPDSGVCLQVPATTTLSFSASADSGATIAASINGNDATIETY